MNKAMTAFLATLGGIDATFYIFTPIFLSILWVSFVNVFDWKVYIFYGVGLFATLFRAIKIGFLKN